MSKALELAKECGASIFTASGEGSQVITSFSALRLDAFFRRAQAMALRDAARVIENSNPQVAGKVQQWADELEAGK